MWSLFWPYEPTLKTYAFAATLYSNELISLTVVTTGNRAAKGYQYHIDFISTLEAALVADLASSITVLSLNRS